MKLALARGLHYQNPLVYNFFAALKLGRDYHLRYRIAAGQIRPGESILDVCAGFGEFKKFLPGSCDYRAVEASPSFHKILAAKNIPFYSQNLHQGLRDIPKFKVITMVISLCQFRNTSLHQLLEDFKKIAEKIVIVEDVLPDGKRTPPIVERFRDHLCATDYYLPMQLFTAKDFQSLMDQHGYECYAYNDRYWVGRYERKGS